MGKLHLRVEHSRVQPWSETLERRADEAGALWLTRPFGKSAFRGAIELLPAPGLNKHSKWIPYLIAPSELGSKLLDIARHAPAEGPLRLPGTLLMLRG